VAYAVDTVVCPPDDGCNYHPKHVEQFPDINKLCNVASCWIYIGILLRAHPILHISRIRVTVNFMEACVVCLLKVLSRKNSSYQTNKFKISNTEEKIK
jgi:hypothetical protein